MEFQTYDQPIINNRTIKCRRCTTMINIHDHCSELPEIILKSKEFFKMNYTHDDLFCKRCSGIIIIQCKSSAVDCQQENNCECLKIFGFYSRKCIYNATFILKSR